MTPVKSWLEEKGAEKLNGESHGSVASPQKNPLKKPVLEEPTITPWASPPAFGQAARTDSCCIPPAPLRLILGLDGEAETFPLLG